MFSTPTKTCSNPQSSTLCPVSHHLPAPFYGQVQPKHQEIMNLSVAIYEHSYYNLKWFIINLIFMRFDFEPPRLVLNVQYGKDLVSWKLCKHSTIILHPKIQSPRCFSQYKQWFLCHVDANHRTPVQKYYICIYSD